MPHPKGTPLDAYIGARTRERREMLAMTQKQLADLVGVTYQQQHKYEAGKNRISGGRLYQIAKALGVSMDYFVEGFEKPRSNASS